MNSLFYWHGGMNAVTVVILELKVFLLFEHNLFDLMVLLSGGKLILSYAPDSIC